MPHLFEEGFSERKLNRAHSLPSSRFTERMHYRAHPLPSARFTERTHFCVRHFIIFHTLDERLRVSFIKVIDCKNVTSLFVSQKTTVEATSTYSFRI